MRNKEKVFVNDSFYVDIYLIGYKPIGESILFIIYVDDKRSYVGVIDSYELNEINRTIEILKKLNIERLDFLCWTHPDKDHSLGIDTLLNYVDKNTKVFIPPNVESRRCQFNERILKTFENINNIKATRQNYSIRTAQEDQGLDSRNFEYFNIEPIMYELKLKSIAPHSSIIEKRNVSNADKIKLNDYSIAIYMNIGEYKFFFGGDVENQTLERIDFDIPESYDYIKVPHHTSESADEVFNIIFSEKTVNEIACTTTFSNSDTKLPDSNIIESYKKCTNRFYCTDKDGIIDSKEDFKTGILNIPGLDDKDKNENEGVIYTRFDILKDDFYTGVWGCASEI